MTPKFATAAGVRNHSFSVAKSTHARTHTYTHTAVLFKKHTQQFRPGPTPAFQRFLNHAVIFTRQRARLSASHICTTEEERFQHVAEESEKSEVVGPQRTNLTPPGRLCAPVPGLGTVTGKPAKRSFGTKEGLFALGSVQSTIKAPLKQ